MWWWSSLLKFWAFLSISSFCLALYSACQCDWLENIGNTRPRQQVVASSTEELITSYTSTEGVRSNETTTPEVWFSQGVVRRCTFVNGEWSGGIESVLDMMTNQPPSWLWGLSAYALCFAVLFGLVCVGIALLILLSCCECCVYLLLMRALQLFSLLSLLTLALALLAFLAGMDNPVTQGKCRDIRPFYPGSNCTIGQSVYEATVALGCQSLGFLISILLTYTVPTVPGKLKRGDSKA